MKKIVVCQFYTNNISYGEYTEKINSEYCKRNNYTYYVEKNESLIKEKCKDRSFHWYKPHLVQNIIKDNPECEYILYMDMDAVFINHYRKIEEFISEGVSVLMTEDHGFCMVNTGVILFKNDQYTIEVLENWWHSGEELPEYKQKFWWDQSVIKPIFERLKDKSKFKIIPNHDFNSRVFDKNKFIFHAFAYGQLANRTLDNVYYNILDIKRPKYSTLLEMAPSYGTDKHYEHNYFELVYDRVLSPLKYQVKTFMEIGVFNGDSIMLWRDFFENAKIIGIEKFLENTLNAVGDVNLNRIKLLKFDCSLEEDLKKLSSLYSDVDIILDDASHKMLDQQLTFSYLFSSLKSGGVYIIEDLHTSFEVNMSDKAAFGWGDPTKTLTLDMLTGYQNNGKLKSDYISDSNLEYLENNIKSVEIYQNRPDWSVTSIITKR